MSEKKKNTTSDSLLDDNGIEILKAVIKSKESLFRKAFDSEKMDIIVDDEKITFTWFSIMDGTEANAYSTFIEHLCNHAKTLKGFLYSFRLLKTGFSHHLLGSCFFGKISNIQN